MPGGAALAAVRHRARGCGRRSHRDAGARRGPGATLRLKPTAPARRGGVQRARGRAVGVATSAANSVARRRRVRGFTAGDTQTKASHHRRASARSPFVSARSQASWRGNPSGSRYRSGPSREEGRGGWSCPPRKKLSCRAGDQLALLCPPPRHAEASNITRGGQPAVWVEDGDRERDDTPVPSDQQPHILREHMAVLDRKSTRLNSSHQIISYAVFCLKKKKENAEHHPAATNQPRHHHQDCHEPTTMTGQIGRAHIPTRATQ